MTQIILDTSVAAKWFSSAGEKDTEPAFYLLNLIRLGKLEVVCPRIIILELANALFWGKGFKQEDCLQSLQSLADLCAELTDLPDNRILTDLIYQYKLTSYDAVFLATALQRNVSLVTADYKHHQKSISPHIVWLTEVKDRF